MAPSGARRLPIRRHMPAFSSHPTAPVRREPLKGRDHPVWRRLPGAGHPEFLKVRCPTLRHTPWVKDPCGWVLAESRPNGSVPTAPVFLIYRDTCLRAVERWTPPAGQERCL
jgi:hypothetical protein